MNKKFVMICLLGVVALQEKIHGDNFGGGFATGALLGTGITLAATSASRRPQDPYYYVEQEKANQELREMRAQDRLRREEKRQARMQKREDERLQREHLKRIKQKQREKERSQARKQTSSKKKAKKTTTKNQPTKKKTYQNQQPAHHKKEVQSPEDLQLEIKKLELEIAQLKLNKKQEDLQTAAAA